LYLKSSVVGRLDRNLVPAMTSDGIAINPWHFKTSIAAATLYTSVEDYAKFVANVLNNDHLLKQLTTTSVTVGPRLNLSWGLGWGIEHSEGDLFIWHWGNNPGYRTFVMASVQSGDGLVMFTNSDNGLALAEPITNRVLPGEHKVFQFYMLRDGIAYFMCETLDFCI
jgi:CubicO group peptidase (beta-lactamase class C family)